MRQVAAGKSCLGVGVCSRIQSKKERCEMTKKKSGPNLFGDELLKNVFAELEKLETDTSKLALEAQKTANSYWSRLSSELSPALEIWKQALRVQSMWVLSIEKMKLKMVPDLSNYCKIDCTSLRDSSNTLDTKFGSGAHRNTMLAIASLDMQIDFDTQTIFVPLSFSDFACGIIIAKVEAISPTQYQTTATSTKQLCSTLKELVSPKHTKLLHAEAS